MPWSLERVQAPAQETDRMVGSLKIWSIVAEVGSALKGA